MILFLGPEAVGVGPEALKKKKVFFRIFCC